MDAYKDVTEDVEMFRHTPLAHYFLSPRSLLVNRTEYHRYPFLLPNLVVALVALFSVPLILFGLPETLDKNVRVRHKRMTAR